MSGNVNVVRVGEFEVERHYLTFVESELKRHAYRKRRLRDIETSCIFGTPEEDLTGMPRGPGVGNPTLSKATALITNQERAHLSMMVMRIEEVYKTLTPLQKDIIRVLYWDGRWTVDGAIDEIKVSRRTFFRQRNGALLAFVLALVGDHAVGTNMAP